MGQKKNAVTIFGFLSKRYVAFCKRYAIPSALWLGLKLSLGEMKNKYPEHTKEYLKLEIKCNLLPRYNH